MCHRRPREEAKAFETLQRDTPSQTKHNTTKSSKVREWHISNLNIYPEETDSQNIETYSSWTAGIQCHRESVSQCCRQALLILGMCSLKDKDKDNNDNNNNNSTSSIQEFILTVTGSRDST